MKLSCVIVSPHPVNTAHMHKMKTDRATQEIFSLDRIVCSSVPLFMVWPCSAEINLKMNSGNDVHVHKTNTLVSSYFAVLQHSRPSTHVDHAICRAWRYAFSILLNFVFVGPSFMICFLFLFPRVCLLSSLFF